MWLINDSLLLQCDITFTYLLNDVFSPSVSFNSDINELTEPVLKKWLKSRKKTLCDIMSNQVMEYLLYSKVCVPLSLSLSLSCIIQRYHLKDMISSKLAEKRNVSQAHYMHTCAHYYCEDEDQYCLTFNS